MSGVGIQPAGLTPAGVGTPSVGTANMGVVMRSATDGTIANARNIDPGTRQYVIGTNGRITGMTSTRQLVQLAVSTTLGSSVVKQLGNDLSRVDRITDNFARRVSDVFTIALASLVARKLIAINAIDVQQVQGSRAYALIKWTDLSTGLEESLPI